MQHSAIVRFGGAAFIAGALAFVCVFSYLAMYFNYPAVLDGSAAEVLPRLRDGGAQMRAVWAVYAILPLFLIPGATGMLFACPSSRPRMTLAVLLASLAALAMCLGLMRWPSIHWALAGAYPEAGPDARSSLDAVFIGLNLYLGNYIGEFLGETLLAAFFLLASLSMRVEARFPAWLGWSGVAFAIMFFIGAFRNVTAAVQHVADLNNGLLPLWMLVQGTALLWYARHPDTTGKV
jgi:hypothetical protein